MNPLEHCCDPLKGDDGIGRHCCSNKNNTCDVSDYDNHPDYNIPCYGCCGNQMVDQSYPIQSTYCGACFTPAGKKSDCPHPGRDKQYVLVVDDGSGDAWVPTEEIPEIGKLLCKEHSPLDSQYPYCLSGVQGGEIFWKGRQLCKTTRCSKTEDCFDDH